VNLNSLFLGEKLFQTDQLFVVCHPKPAYQVHLLILPKKPIASLVELHQCPDFWNQVPQVITALVKTYIPEGEGYRIITNGGTYQEIPILHLHFISGENID
jgi:histidine triad (HIT) family protein